MVTVLGVITLASVLAFAAADTGRLALGGTRNRIDEARDFWFAQGCAARALAELDARWVAEEGLGRDRLWRTMDAELASVTRDVDLPCAVRLESGGIRLDLRRTSAASLARLVAAVAPSANANRVGRAIIDWYDSQYPTSGPVTPSPLRRHALASHLRESQGMADTIAGRITALLSNGTGPVHVGRAPIEVLAALPGFNARTARALGDLREREPHLRDLYAMLGGLTREDAAELSAAFLELSREASFEPTTWVLDAVAITPGGASVAVSWSIGRSPRHLVAAPEVR